MAMANMLAVLEDTQQVLDTLESQISNSSQKHDWQHLSEGDFSSSSNFKTNVFSGFVQQEKDETISSSNNFRVALQRLQDCIQVTNLVLARHPEMVSIKQFYDTVNQLYNNVKDYLRASVRTQLSTLKLLNDSNVFRHEMHQKRQEHLLCDQNSARGQQYENEHTYHKQEIRNRNREANFRKLDVEQEPYKQNELPVQYQWMNRNVADESKSIWMEQFKIILDEAQKLLVDIPPNIRIPSMADFLDFIQEFIRRENNDVFRKEVKNTGEWSTTMKNMFKNVESKYEDCAQVKELAQKFPHDLHLGRQNLEAIQKDTNYRKSQFEGQF